jgi:general secretion pathway protein A
MEDEQFHLSMFGLHEQPFAPTADPTYFYATQEHKSCLFRLWSSIDERHGIAVVLGNYGTGKTTLLRKLMTGMAADHQRYNTAVIGSPIPSWTSFSLLEAIVNQFNLKPSKRTFGDYMESLSQYLMINRKRINTLIVDDAQNLNKRGQLELLRLVHNLETPQHKLLNLVLFSQLEWTRVLEAAPNFQQRINLTYTLGALNETDVRNFIKFRLAHAGGVGDKAPQFTDSAYAMILAYSEGNPRLIVTACRNILLFASQIRTRQIDHEMVYHTVQKTTMTNKDMLRRMDAVMHQYSSQVPTSTLRKLPVIQSEPAFKSVSAPVSTGSTKSNTKRANDLLLKAEKLR